MTLQNKVYQLACFKSELKKVLIQSCLNSLRNVKVDQEDEQMIDWNYLLSCASILSTSVDYDHLESALRVAQSTLELPSSNQEQRVAAGIVLDNLTNQPAIYLALKRQLLDENYFDNVPLPLVLDSTRRRVAHTLITKNGIVYLNKFQKEAFDKFNSTDVVSVSAPTSAGKSFILNQAVIRAIDKSSALLSIVYLVPTRALISQVEKDFNNAVKLELLPNVVVSSVPVLEEGDLSKHKVFIFTQERLHWFKVSNPDFNFDFVIVDEAQKIGEGKRGILLQQKLEELIGEQKQQKVFFSSPLSANPEILYSNINENKTRVPVKTEFVAVNQNLIYVSQVRGKPKVWKVELCHKNGVEEVGRIDLPNSPSSEYKRVAFVSHELSGGEGGNIIYVNRAYDAEVMSNVLFDVVGEAEMNEEIDSLIDYIKNTVHRQYLLTKVLKRRIAFHYGNMPLLIRTEIERLFEKGLIKYLVCTSTLLEGVNLPAKNIFLRKPSRGSGNPLDGTDFWNLAGRAGRWGKEFQGNIICIDPYNWDLLPSLENKKQEIKKSIDRVSENVGELIEFIRAGTPRSLAKQEDNLEYALTYYYSNFIKGRLENLLVHQLELFETLKPELDAISLRIEIPDDIILRNPGISPLAQQNLLDHFKEKIDVIERYIPDYPESIDAVNNTYLTRSETLQDIYRVIQSCLTTIMRYSLLTG
jgi:hypothetical protein